MPKMRSTGVLRSGHTNRRTHRWTDKHELNLYPLSRTVIKNHIVLSTDLTLTNVIVRQPRFPPQDIG